MNQRNSFLDLIVCWGKQREDDWSEIIWMIVEVSLKKILKINNFGDEMIVLLKICHKFNQRYV